MGAVVEPALRLGHERTAQKERQKLFWRRPFVAESAWRRINHGTHRGAALQATQTWPLSRLRGAREFVDAMSSCARASYFFSFD